MTALLNRWVHIASAALMLGGAALLWALASRGSRRGVPPRSPSDQTDLLLFAAERYEWLFWGALGLIVLTGIGNLGAFGFSIPDPDTVWGVRLTVKLALVGAFMLFSLLRTLVVVRARQAGESLEASRAIRLFRIFYPVTALTVFGILLLAVLLAHG